MKPILFNTEMVRAILKGRKTVTRRVIKPVALRMTYEDGDPARKPPYQPGDLLYVRETWAIHQCNDRLPPSIPCQKTAVGRDCYIYKADGASGKTPCGVHPSPHKWHPSIHMPKEAARLFLRVTDVRVERLRDITDEQARKEGCADRQDFARVWNDCYSKPRPVKGEDGTICHYESYPWEDIRETRTYRGKPWHVHGNPWVWVIEFERGCKEEV